MKSKIKRTSNALKTKPDFKELEKLFEGDLDLVLFFVSWIKNGRNATEAYHELNPKVSRLSAQVLGSRQLAKIDRIAIMKSYGLGLEEYFSQLQEGLEATKWNDFTGEREADHNTRKNYHDKLGKLLGLETNQNNLQVNVIPILGGASSQPPILGDEVLKVMEVEQDPIDISDVSSEEIKEEVLEDDDVSNDGKVRQF